MMRDRQSLINETQYQSQSQDGGDGLIRSNHYVPNLRLILNADNGEIIKNAPYLSAKENWAVVGVVSSQDSRGCHVPGGKKCTPNPGGKKCTPEKRKKRQKYAVPGGKKHPLRSDSVVEGGASALPPASGDPAANGSAPRQKEESRQRKAGYISIKSLADELDLTFDRLIQLFNGKGSPGDIEKLDGLCGREIFNPTSEILQKKFPSDVAVYGHVIIIGGEGQVHFMAEGNHRIPLQKLGTGSWLVLDYLSPGST